MGCLNHRDIEGDFKTVRSPSKSTLLFPVWENQVLDLKPHFTSTFDSVTMHRAINCRAIESRGEAYNHHDYEVERHGSKLFVHL